MTPENKTRLKQLMGEQIVDLKREIEDLAQRAGTVDLDQPIGRLSRMDSLANQGILAQAVAKSRDRLKRLEAALERVDHPDYGLCEECGEEIALPRLMALPEAELCINCAS
jgi:DnaK suppressor protein